MTNTIAMKMELPKVPDIELVALNGLALLGKHLGIADDKIGEARILVTEAVINALEHGGKEHPKVEVEFTMTSRELTIFVRDYGKGFVPSEVEQPDIKLKIGSRNKRGWGLKLMQSMSDDFRIDSTVEGTKITIKKKLV
ncbi:MAG TPA: ATP-binding protein [Bacteroidota bacterium]|nr:ATP-binding protein [Bacteroidota bacterium]